MRVLQATCFGAIGILLSSAAMADGHLDTLSAEDLLPMAQEEGTVTVYSFTSRIGRVEAAFEEAYPGIDLQGFDISSTEQIARLRAEAQAGVTNADVIYISDTPVVLTELWKPASLGLMCRRAWLTACPLNSSRRCWRSAFPPRC